MRWVDYSGKYGLAYQLSNSTSGMYFNDSTSIILSSETTYNYLNATGEITNGLISKHDATLDKKIKLALRYKGYMTNNLHGTESNEINPDKIFLVDFQRVVNAVLFRMSNDVFQVPNP
jgi:hypothetical protein